MDEVFINSLVKNGKLFLTINRSIKVCETSELSAITFYTVFNSTIDAICTVPNDKFLIICLRNGIIHLFDMEADNNCIFTK